MEKKENKICSICLEEILKKNDVILKLGCCHKFHLYCIKKLIKSTYILCPNCRTKNIYVDKCKLCDYRAKKFYAFEPYCLTHYNNLIYNEIKNKDIDIEKILNDVLK